MSAGAEAADLAAADRRALLERLLAEEGLGLPAADGPRPRPDRSAPAPLSFAQQRLWFLERFEPGGAAYNVPGALRLAGPAEAAALRRALGRLARRHEVLGSVLRETPEGPVQSAGDGAGPGWAEEDLEALAPAAREAALLGLLAEEAARPFDLERGPLLRARLIRLERDEHVLALTMHHAVADQWSLGLIAAELAALYGEEAGRGPAGLAPLPVQYADFAAWQRAWREGPECRAQVAWWRERLRGLEPLELPTDHPRPGRPAPEGAIHRFRLPAEARAGLEAVAQREGATLFMALLAVFLAELHRWTGRRDLAVGTPVSGRSRPETAPLIGFFTNTLVLRAAYAGEPGFRAWLRTVRSACVEAYARQDAPFELLVEELQPPRELDRNPWFDTLFVLQEARPEPQLPGLRAAYLPTEIPAAKFDLTLTVLESPRGALEAWIEYRRALFAPETIERLGRHFCALAQAAGAEPDRPVLDLEMLGAEERRQVLLGFNATARAYQGDPRAHVLFEQQAARTPEAPALSDGRERLTYAELEGRSNRLARRLQRLGVGPDVIVGLCLGRSVDLGVAVLGVLKAGGCYLPLDPGYPADRLAFMLEDARARVVVSHAETRGALAPPDGTALLDLDASDWALEEDERPPCAAGGEHLLYIIYTSGSTGRPKGVTLSHRALTNLLRWHLETMLTGAKGLLFASLSFDASFHEMFAVLGGGGELHVAGEEIRRDSALLLACLERERIAKVVLPVVVLQQIAADHLDRAAGLSGLREVTTTGEALVLTPAIIELFRRLPECVLHNHYGPSETHVVTAYRFPGPPRSLRPPPPIGGPVANTRAYVLDRRGHPAPIGAAGELFFAGANLGRCYHGRPELTAERFVPDPFAAGPGGRLYRTGDLARWLPDGNLEFLGRLDDQVKIRGFRVEPGEIETLLSKHPAVAAAAVVARERAPGDKLLVAYVVRREGSSADVAGLRAFLGGHLPDYMVPTAFLELAALPLTPSGKVDRRALPAPDAALLARDAAFVPPATEAEKVAAEVWCELLGAARVGLDDNFFHLGGHSLLAARLVARIRARTTLEVPLRALFERPTLRGWVGAMAEAAGGRPVLEEIAQTVREAEAG
ncbi:MAG TPA: amino acid adenylation domain-containing protein [Opitutaceae bacterium]|nr:amino acid adenylation domain-containing protein [Opitutaceae bacterium]